MYGNIVAWMVGICTGLRRSQAKTLADVVVGAMRCRRVSLADLGRSMRSSALAKHRIKRVWRFLRNERVEAPEAMRAMIRLAAKAAKWRLVVAVDWVDVRQYKVLRAAVPLRGRSVPVLFAAYLKWDVLKSQNAFEEGFFTLLRALLPERTELVLIADRGFHRAELARTLQSLGLSYVIRTNGKTYFSTDTFHGPLDSIRLRPGRHCDLGFGAYRKHRSVRQRVVVYWRKRYAEPWFLATDLDRGWRTVVAAYAQRMSIEELFRDEKNLRYGWGLRQSQVSNAQRLERLLLVLAFAYLLLLLLGFHCMETLSPAHWSAASSPKKRQASAFFVGRLLYGEIRCPLRQLLRLLSALLSQIAKENWG
ncbi:MAG: IS4 family transposase [Chloroflexi bacterium]|nr:IS4 family transposase [Chloroflexota bacterium]